MLPNGPSVTNTEGSGQMTDEPIPNKSLYDRPVRYETLDGIRGFAALLIVLFHITWPNHITHNRFVENGYLMVDLFFILSGFVISVGHPEPPADAVGVGKFLCLRLFRIYPLHLVVLVAFVGLELIKLLALRHGIMAPAHMPFTGGNSLAALIANVFLVQSWDIFGYLSWNGVSWYVSCLFGIYILFAIGIFSILMRNKLVFFAAVALALSGYAVLAVSHQTLNISYDLGLVRCACGFFLGMSVRHVSRCYPGILSALLSSWWLPWIKAGTLAAMVLVMSLARTWVVVLVIPLFVLLVFMFQTDHGVVYAILKSHIAKFLSRISYSVYMFQLLILVTSSMILNKFFRVAMSADALSGMPCLQIGPWSGDILLAVDMAVIVAIGATASLFIEEPARLFGKRLIASMNRN
jgi:peptidoglycan/LPS O-acetylase OafA/YrhL